MIRSSTRAAAVFLLALLFTASARAEVAVETETFRLALPEGWATGPKSPPSAKGRNGELLQFSASSVASTRSAKEAEPILRRAEERALVVLSEIEHDGRFKTLQPLSAQPLPGGYTLHRIVSETKDGKQVLAQFVVTGPRTVLLVTLDALAQDAASVETIAAALRGIEWRR